MKDIVSDGWDVTRRKKKFIASEFFRNFFVTRKLLWKSKKAKLKRPVSLKALYLSKEMFKAPFWNCGKKLKKWNIYEMLWRKTFIHLISSISKRKKLSVSMRNQTPDLLIPGFKPLSLNQRGSLTRILHTATISNVENVICVNRQEKFTLFFITFWDSKFTIFLIWKVVWCSRSTLERAMCRPNQWPV